MTAVLALDLGTQLGYAILRADNRIESGVESFHVKPREGPGQRFARFKRWLVDVKQANPDLARVAWERVSHVGANQAYAAQVHGGFLAILQVFCEHHGIPYEGFAIATIKKQFAGSGRAQKADMIAQCRALGFNVTDNNEADAIGILHVATGRCPLLTKSGATPKKRVPKRPPEAMATAGENPF